MNKKILGQKKKNALLNYNFYVNDDAHIILKSKNYCKVISNYYISHNYGKNSKLWQLRHYEIKCHNYKKVEIKEKKNKCRTKPLRDLKKRKKKSKLTKTPIVTKIHYQIKCHNYEIKSLNRHNKNTNINCFYIFI